MKFRSPGRSLGTYSSMAVNREHGMAHPGMLRPPYFENEFWRYRSGDWYEHDPCSSVEQAPEWYAPDLIRDILSAKVKHEIACHTFSHIDCSDKHCPPELMEAELAECQSPGSGVGD